MDILNRYEVKFVNTFEKQIHSINTWLSAYINDHYTIEEIERLLNKNINKVLNSEIEKGGGQTQSLYFADITILETKIYQDMEAWEFDNTIKPDFTLPTSHFKIIVEAWRDYILK